jgi:hypothetical protein
VSTNNAVPRAGKRDEIRFVLFEAGARVLPELDETQAVVAARVRARLVRDALLGFALIPVSLAFILGGVYAAGWILYGTLTPPYLFRPLPLPAATYGALVWPFIWGLAEQMTYNGYLMPRFQVLCRSTSRAVALVAFAWSFQHVVMPLTFDQKFMAFRMLSPIPFSVFQTLLYLRLRRLVPFVIVHALMDGASVLIGVLLPQLWT